MILEVEDARAVYPVRIDPLFTQQQKLTASDGADDDYFGDSVAISGDTVVVGALMTTLAHRSRLGLCLRAQRHPWSQQQKLTARDAADLFGYSVAISGDTVVVGHRD